MHILNQHGWRRRATFEHFSAFEQPYFNVCCEIDVTTLKAFLVGQQHKSLFLAYHFLALRDDNTFAFADLVMHDRWDVFAARAAVALEQARDPSGTFSPTKTAIDVVHFSTLPWIRFTGLSHPQRTTRHTAIPKISFGKLSLDAGRFMLPMSVEVHHGLVDGLHIGRMVELLESSAASPQAALFEGQMP